MFDLLKEIMEEWGDYGIAEKTYWLISGLLFATGFIAFSGWFWSGMFAATDNLTIALVFGGFLYLILTAIAVLLCSPLMTVISLATAAVVGISSWLVGLCRQVRT